MAFLHPHVFNAVFWSDIIFATKRNPLNFAMAWLFSRVCSNAHGMLFSAAGEHIRTTLPNAARVVDAQIRKLWQLLSTAAGMDVPVANYYIHNSIWVAYVVRIATSIDQRYKSHYIILCTIIDISVYVC
jgi:hypothetical protein